jgi:hypothetical protein
MAPDHKTDSSVRFRNEGADHHRGDLVALFLVLPAASQVLRQTHLLRQIQIARAMRQPELATIIRDDLAHGDFEPRPLEALRLHPNAAALYAAKIADLQAALNQPDVRLEAMAVLRSLIERIVLTPDESAPNGLAIELFGDLATILNLAAAQRNLRRPKPLGARQPPPPGDAGVFGSTLSMVAGPRNHRQLTTLQTSC